MPSWPPRSASWSATTTDRTSRAAPSIAAVPRTRPTVPIAPCHTVDRPHRRRPFRPGSCSAPCAGPTAPRSHRARSRSRRRTASRSAAPRWAWTDATPCTGWLRGPTSWSPPHPGSGPTRRPCLLNGVGAAHDFALRGTGALHRTVSRDGRARLPDVLVVATDAEGHVAGRTRTGADGRWTLTGVPARRDDGRGEPPRLPARDHRGRRHRTEPRPPSTSRSSSAVTGLAGTVRAADGAPLAGPRSPPTDAQGDVAAVALTDPAGGYAMRGPGTRPLHGRGHRARPGREPRRGGGGSGDPAGPRPGRPDATRARGTPLTARGDEMTAATTTGRRATPSSRPTSGEVAGRLRLAMARLGRRLVHAHPDAGMTPTRLTALGVLELGGPLRIGGARRAPRHQPADDVPARGRPVRARPRRAHARPGRPSRHPDRADRRGRGAAARPAPVHDRRPGPPHRRPHRGPRAALVAALPVLEEIALPD